MRDLSLHILDLIENSLRAEASVISVSVLEYPDEDTLEITVEDNGPGLDVPYEVATDPFYTTKNGKRTGLGLSLFRAAAERANGKLMLGKSKLGGLSVKAIMRLNHIDRSPMGDLAATISSVVSTNPGVDLRFRLCVGMQECTVWVSDVVNDLPPSKRDSLLIALQMSERINRGLEQLRP